MSMNWPGLGEDNGLMGPQAPSGYGQMGGLQGLLGQMAGAVGGALGGTPSGPDAAYPGSGAVRPPGALGTSSEQRMAVMRALQANGGGGYNPFHPVVKAVLSRASELMDNLLMRIASPDRGGSPANLTSLLQNEGGLQSAVQDIVRQAMSGGKVYGGGREGELGRLQAALGDPLQPSGDLGRNFLLDLLYDPSRALNLRQSTVYGGLHPRFQEAAGAYDQSMLSSFLKEWEDKGSPTQRDTILDFLGRYMQGQGGAATPPPTPPPAPGLAGLLRR